MTDTVNVTVHGLRAANIARQAEWDPSDKITLSYRLNELAGETGEACNVGKKIERERLGIRGSRDTLEHLGEELADVVICADLVAMSEGIDLDAAIEAKFNATSEKVGLSTRLSLAAAPKVEQEPDTLALKAYRLLTNYADAVAHPQRAGIRKVRDDVYAALQDHPAPASDELLAAAIETVAKFDATNRTPVRHSPLGINRLRAAIANHKGPQS